MPEFSAENFQFIENSIEVVGKNLSTTNIIIFLLVCVILEVVRNSVQSVGKFLFEVYCVSWSECEVSLR